MGNNSRVNPGSSASADVAISQKCNPETSLLFEDPGISVYTEDQIRGTSVVSFQFEINERLDIYNMDGSAFGFLVLNEDGGYYTLDMPHKTTARRIIPEQDFAAFDFDAEPLNTDLDFLLIYVNKEKRKVKKDQLKYTYQTWPEYLRNSVISLKPCNFLEAPDGTIIKKSIDQYFNVIAVKGDLIEIKSTKPCQAEDPYLEMRGWVKWRAANCLLINFAVCN